MPHPIWELLSNDDFSFAASLVGMRDPDLIIGSPPYLHRWYVVPRNDRANIYLHVQVASDPDRPLHDHPWDNQSVILSGGYDEVLDSGQRAIRNSGQVVFRYAEYAHRLVLPEDVPYTMTLFTTGPRVRDWGFHTKQGWIDARECTEFDPAGHSVYMGPKE